MPSVFSTPPPVFSELEVTEMLHSQFGVSGTATELYSDRDQNFLINESDGQKSILKISNPAEEKSILDMQYEATHTIYEKDPTLYVPLQIGEIKFFEKNYNTYFIRRMEFLKGNFLKDQKLNEKSFEQLGVFLGRLSQALDGFSHPAAKRPFEWDVQTVDLIKSRCNYLTSQSKKETIFYFLNEYKENVFPMKQDLRMAVIHNDGNDHNVLVNGKGEATGIIDFGDMVFSYQVVEIAVCMAYVGLEKDNPFSVIAHVLKGYHSIFPLNKSELKSAIYFSSIRLCISVTMSAWRMKLFPGNEYLSVSQKSAWELLYKLRRDDLNQWSNKIILDHHTTIACNQTG